MKLEKSHLNMQEEANTNCKACTHDFRSFIKVNQYSIDLNVRCETEQLPEEGMRGNLGDCPNFISVAVIKYPNKQQSGENGFALPHNRSQVPIVIVVMSRPQGT